MRHFLSLKVLAVGLFCVVGATVFAAQGVRSRAPANALSEGLLIEGDLKQGSREIAGRVLVEAGRAEWATIAMAPATKTEPALRLEARASLVDSDVVEVETRVTGREERFGKLLVQLGARGELTQVEGAEDVVSVGTGPVAGSSGAGSVAANLASGSAVAAKAGAAPSVAPGATSVAVKVLRVRYSL